MPNVVYTVGHSTHSIEKFIDLLKVAPVTVVSDVRSAPYSRQNPQFNREFIKEKLREQNIKYVYLGKELGARSENQSCYKNGQVQYDLLAQTELFKKGIERLREGAQQHVIALMCAEKEPLDCHRTILVAKALSETGIEIKHILADGKIETHDHAIERLFTKFRIPLEEDFYDPKENRVKLAYAQQAKEIAYMEQRSESEELSQ